MNHISKNSVANPERNPISIPRESESFQILPRYSVNDYVKHVYTKGKYEGESEGVELRGVVINVDLTRFSYFGAKIPAYLVGWEDGDESWVSGGSIRGCNGGFNVKEMV